VERRGRRIEEPLEGKMTGTLNSDAVSTKLQRIAELARSMPQTALTNLSHHIDVEWLHEAFRRTRKDGAAGVDGQTWSGYEKNLATNLASLLTRFKSGSYRAPPVRRVHIPKGDGTETRPIGIPTLEDKVLQRAVAMCLNAVYEQDFLDCSYGFRPGRSAHNALDRLRTEVMDMWGGWLVEVDIRRFFDTLDHAKLRAILEQRVRDGVILRVIGKWLNAGVLEGGSLSFADQGTPQGGVISPLLANVYLHEVLDKWIEALRGRLRDLVPRGARCSRGVCSAAEALRGIRPELAPGQNALDSLSATAAPRSEGTCVVRLPRLHPCVDEDDEGHLGRVSGDEPEATHAVAVTHPHVARATPSRPDRDAAIDAEPENARSLRVLRQDRKRAEAPQLLRRSATRVEIVAGSTQLGGRSLLGALPTHRRSTSAAASASRARHSNTPQQILDLTSRMRESRKSGSVGGRGEQSPRPTRRRRSPGPAIEDSVSVSRCVVRL
jgi:retron-type reverse transcriptase